jgi:hypothetical protein
MDDDHFGSGMIVASVIWIFLCIILTLIINSTWRVSAIRAGVGQYSSKTGDFEWIEINEETTEYSE